MNQLSESCKVLAFPSSEKPEFRKQGESVKVDINNGYMRIANELIEAISRLDVSGRQFRILMAVIRKTIGFNLEVDWIAPQQIAELIHYEGDISHIYADLRILKARNILFTKGRNKGINLVTSEWIYQKPKTVKTSRNRPQNWQKMATTEEPKLAETGQKTSGNSLQKWPKTATNENEKLAENGYSTSRNRPQKLAEISQTQKTKNTIPKNNIPPMVPPQGENPTNTISKSRTRSPTKRATQAPEKFQLTPELVQWANEKLIQVNLVAETEKFLDYHRAKGSTFKCWASAWRNWMRNAQKFAAEKQTQPVGPANTSELDWDDTSWRFNLGL
ncbi:replication protein [Endozoicomonas sp. SM1973]|uniref:Replication protein n=1 Tax=Spartinivicinus marinus TaxID=2994442 RepID=A0A853IG57_9GAMM|nr:replication protein [Spartinivicinus marinus]MCX4025075.1 replication protein [Spartinivicinus marinus]NYZ68971.1 replication protein [Spartinivicinus marinus]